MFTEVPPRAEEPAGPLDGAFWLDTVAVPVDTLVQVEGVYQVGSGGLVPGDRLRLADPLFHGIHWSWGELSPDPADCGGTWQGGQPIGLVTVEAESEEGRAATLAVERRSGSIHFDAGVVVEVLEGELHAGDRLRFRLGDLREDPACGWRSSPRALERVPMRLYEDDDRDQSTSGWRAVEPAPELAFLASSEVAVLHVAAPSQVRWPGELRLRVALLDAAGNPARGAGGRLLWRVVGGEAAGEATVEGPVTDLWVPAADSGILRVDVTWEGSEASLAARSNPAEVGATHTPVHWGDIHTHHGHSWRDTAGFLHDDNHAYARDVLGLQVAAESMKAAPLEVDHDAVWAELQEACEGWTVAGEYVALLGFEWMGPYDVAGHHNVYYDACTGLLGDESMPGLEGDAGLWAFQREVEAQTGAGSVSIPHSPGYTGFDWVARDDALRPVAEIVSRGWGPADFAAPDSPGSGVYDALGQGQRFGFIGSTDHHLGWPGNRWGDSNLGGSGGAGDGTQSGLAAFVTAELTHQGVVQALRDRSVYATTGVRALLRFSAWDGSRVEMGQRFIAARPNLSWTYHAQDEAAVVTLYTVTTAGRDAQPEVLGTWWPGTADAHGELDYAFDGQPRAVWLHVVESSGEEAWSSPIWLEVNCANPDNLDPGGRCL